MIGINSNEGFINKNLLTSSNNFSIFNYVFKINVLFPPIIKQNLQKLSNTLGFMPINCAVDDLELYNDDIYDLLNNPTFYEPSQQQPQPLQIQPLQQGYLGYNNKVEYRDYNNVNELKYPSHYNLNMNGCTNYYFNDFNHDLIDLDIYSSSSESFISPLDDEFYKVKRESEGSTITFDSPETFVKVENEGLPVFKETFKPESFKTESFKTETLPSFKSENLPSFKSETLNDDFQKDSKKRKLSEDKRDDDFKFECNHCTAKFKVKGYLTRHLKKHQSFKAFKCPFYHESPSNGKGTKCHPTGGFSRRDTYKTHLKALHFIYPPGTKSNERNLISGRCAGCFRHFENNIDWLKNHIEKGDCNGTLNV